MAIKGVREDREAMYKLWESLDGHVDSLKEDCESVKTLFDNLLQEAAWDNRDSKKFARHYKKGHESLSSEISFFGGICSCILGSDTDYIDLESEVAKLFTDPFWSETLRK